MSRTVTTSPAAAAAAAAVAATMSTDDRVRTFVNQLKVLVAGCFEELYTMVKSKYAQDTQAQMTVFIKCLGKIEDWDVSVRAEEMQRAMEQFAGIREDYKHAAITFVRSLSLGASKCAKLPPFDMFLFYFYRAVARSHEMRQHQYFAMDYLARHAFISDTLHLVLNSCVHVIDAPKPPSVAPPPLPSVAPPPLPSVAPPLPSVAPPLPSVVAAAPPAPVSASAGRAHPAWTAVNAAPATLVARHCRLNDAPILPSDSVSNVGRSSGRKVPPAVLQVAAKPVVVVPRRDEASASVRHIDTSIVQPQPTTPTAATDSEDE